MTTQAVLDPQPTRPRLPLLELILVVAGVLCLSALTGGPDPLAPLNILTWAGVVTLGGLVFAVRRRPFRLWRAASVWAQDHGIDLPLLCMALGLGLVTAVRQQHRLTIDEPYGSTAIVLWVLNWVTLLASVWPREGLQVRSWLRQYRLEAAGLLAATLFAGGLRLYQLGTLPRIINGDEGVIGMWALNVGTTYPWPTLGRYFAAIDGVGTLYLSVMQQLFELFGASPFTLRLLPAIAGTLAIPANYLLARHLIGRRGAVIATGLLLVSHVHLHFSRTVAVSYIYATLFVPLVFYCFLTGMERRSAPRLVLSAVLLGLYLNIYLDAWIWLVLIGLLLIAWLIVDRPVFRGNGINLGLFGIALMVMFTPFVLWARAFSADFTSRMTMEGTFGSGWLANEVVVTGKSAPQLLFELFQFALGTFTEKPFQDFYWAEVPTLDTVSGYLWMVGCGLALWQTRQRRMLLLNGWFWGGIVATSVMSIPPSTYHYRLLMVLPAACMLVGLAADRLLTVLPRLIVGQETPPRWWNGLLVSMLLVGMAQPNLNTYYGTFLGQCRYSSGSPGTREASVLGSYLRTLPAGSLVYLLTEDPAYGFEYGHHRSTDFLSGGHIRPINLSGPVSQEMADSFTLDMHQQAGTQLVVIAVAARSAELPLLQQWFPGGQEVSLQDCDNEALRAYVWR